MTFRKIKNRLHIPLQQFLVVVILITEHDLFMVSTRYNKGGWRGNLYPMEYYNQPACFYSCLKKKVGSSFRQITWYLFSIIYNWSK